ncbi:MAG: FkbM family methyltransferase, partial [Clostridia bacterium]|nr:FkbM family methyltransferase [Clostridia bacterium]
SHCGEGEANTQMRSIDEFCGFTHIHAEGERVGSIKIDAEGMDESVVFGAVNTIYCCKPNLSVALYHRAYDIIELPLLLRKHNPKYKFYLRKKEYIPAWDIFLYAVN